MKNDIDMLFSAYISNEDVEAFQKRASQKVLERNAGFLVRNLYGWILAENNCKINQLSTEILQDPILSKNAELMRRVKKGLSKEDLSFLKRLF